MTEKKIEGRVAGCVMRRGIICESYVRECNVPIFVLVGNVHCEHVGKGPIKAFYEAVRLWMVGCRFFVKNGAEVQDFTYDARYEGPSTVGQKFPRCSVLEDDVFEQELGDVNCRSGQEGPCDCVACGVIDRDRYPAITN